MKSESRCLIIPSEWIQMATEGIARLNLIQPCYYFLSYLLPVQNSDLKKVLKKKTANFGASEALVVLPKSFAQSKNIPFWPKSLNQNSKNEWVCGLFFADDWDELESYLSGLEDELSQESSINVSCQYQPPYTEMLELWQEKGALPFHPGDFFKEEFLSELQSMAGTWIYWGHADGDCLRGYGNLNCDELLKNRPKNPLNLTIWFSCSTLEVKVENNLGISWFLSGSTKSFLGSPLKVKTSDNVHLTKEILSIVSRNPNLTIATVFSDLISAGGSKMRKILKAYHLLGSPWVKF